MASRIRLRAFTIELCKIIGPRLCELAPAATGGQDAGSGNLPLVRGNLYNAAPTLSLTYLFRNIFDVRNRIVRNFWGCVEFVDRVWEGRTRTDGVIKTAPSSLPLETIKSLTLLLPPAKCKCSSCHVAYTLITGRRTSQLHLSAASHKAVVGQGTELELMWEDAP